MVLTRLGDFLYRAGWVISGLLLFDVPPTIFAYAGFAAGWTNVADCIALGVFCTTIGCLSWLAGRAMGDVLTPDIERLPTGAHPGVRARLCRRGHRLRFSSPRRMSPELAHCVISLLRSILAGLEALQTSTHRYVMRAGARQDERYGPFNFVVRYGEHH